VNLLKEVFAGEQGFTHLRKGTYGRRCDGHAASPAPLTAQQSLLLAIEVTLLTEQDV
jgi:hypothetical protein